MGAEEAEVLESADDSVSGGPSRDGDGEEGRGILGIERMGRGKMVQGGRFGHRTGVGLGQKGSFVRRRGGDGGGRRRNDWVILGRDLGYNLGENRKIARPLFLDIRLLLKMLVLLMLQLLVHGGKGGIEIGRDAAAFFSDLNFRFFLMHYIREQLFPRNKKPFSVG